MNVVEQTQTKLTIHDSALSVWILGGILLTATLIISCLPSKDVDTLSCKRVGLKDDSCEIERLNGIGAEHTSIPLSELQTAKVKANIWVDKKGREHGNSSVVLLTNHDDVIFTSHGSYVYQQELISNINNFRQNSAKTSLSEKAEEIYWFKYIIGANLGVIGIYFLFNDEVTWSFDKDCDTFSIKRQGIRGTRFTNYNICNVSDVQVEENTRTNKEGETYKTYKINLLLTSGASLPLTIYLYYLNSREEQRKTAEYICQYLHL